MALYNAFPFQQRAIDEMLESFKNLWRHNTSTTELTLKAPTGSGKTFMTTHFINALNSQPDWDEDVAFVWITFSDELSMQSKAKFDDYFFPNLRNQLLTIADFSQGKLNRNDILFLNWQKLVSRRAADRQNRRPEEPELIKEAGFYFEDVAENTLAEGRQIIMIIDESHKNVTESAYRDVINPLNPRIIVKVSATPEKEPTASQVKNHQAGWVEVDIKDVIEEGLIKKEIVSQTEDDLRRYDKEDLDKLMLDLAIEKREQLIEDWKAYGADINPLILIQLPDDDKDAEARGVEKKETLVMRYLTMEKKFEQKEIVTWLSGVPKTEALKTITKNNSPVAFLLFKYAAGTGWDCPRAHILVMFREIKSNTFRTQTLGRIRRMPVHDKRINDFPSLQIGYLYTNYSRNEVDKIPETDPNKPKTITAKMQTAQRIRFSVAALKEKVRTELEKRLTVQKENQKETVKKVITQVCEKLTTVEEKLSDSSKEIPVLAENLPEYEGEKSKKREKEAEKRAIDEVVKTCDAIIKETHEEIEATISKENQNMAKAALTISVNNFKEEIRGQKTTGFVLDPALKTEFISRTTYGDVGKASEFQSIFIQSMNRWFGIEENEIMTNNISKLQAKGIDTSSNFSWDIMVNARFKMIDQSSENQIAQYEVSANDVEKLFTNLCYQLITEQDDAEATIGNAARSYQKLKSALRMWFKHYALQTYVETDFYKVFIKDIQRNADSKFRPAITQAIKDYYPVLQKQLAEKRKDALEKAPVVFVVYTEKPCPNDYEAYPNKLSLVDLYLAKEYNGRKNETQFIDYLEQKANTIEWWLKNGTGKEDLGFRYMDSTTNEMRVFYPDWIVKFKDGRIGIYDTKGGITAKSQETKDKAECLARHIAELNQSSQKYKYLGGIVEMRNGIWYINQSKNYLYENTEDWNIFL
ncbi:MAG: DEAD/DEAH box helicase family protein [Paludibacteraceae bacterium]|nr:DEAD/DEAH box helicase family protein [Paludibacteraceae bacterium]